MPHREPRRATQEEFERLNRFPDGLDACGALRAELAGSSLNRCSVLDPLDPEKQLVQEKLLHGGFTVQESRAIASLLGNVIGDSLGAPLEFSPVRYGSTELKDFGQQEVWSKPGYNSFGLKPGQWTDDASMALCLADTLLVHQRLEPQDLRLRFLNWWAFGYNNAFGYDTASARHGGSVGLGGNISQSMSEFYRHRTPYTEAGDRYTSGNGSLMRNGPVPVFFAHEREAALDIFHHRYADNPLVLDKWFQTQALSTRDDTPAVVRELAEHPDFTLANPNRARSLVGAFSVNQRAFHVADGSGYRFVADQLVALDRINPQTAAKLLPPLGRWRRFDAARAALMKAELERIVAMPGLSKDLFEQASRSLEG